MSQPPYRVLKVALRIFSVLLAIGALFMIFGHRALVLWIFLHPPETEVSTLLLFLLKETGGIALMISAMLYLASRDFIWLPFHLPRPLIPANLWC